MEALKLINAPFPLEFAGETYQVKKANLEKVILFQTRMTELTNKEDAALEYKMAGYCLFLVLKDVKTDVTEEWVLENAPGDVPFAQIVEQFGFMNRQKVALLRAILERNAPETKTEEEPTGTSSLQ